MMPLALLSPGEQGEIAAIKECLPASLGGPAKGEVRIEDLGLRVGKMVQMLKNGAPVLLKVDEARIAVDRGLAMKIMVREVR